MISFLKMRFLCALHTHLGGDDGPSLFRIPVVMLNQVWADWGCVKDQILVQILGCSWKCFYL